MPMTRRISRVALLGNHLPRACGIATFTTDLTSAIAAEFPRVVSLVLKDSFVVVQADVHNRRDEKQKVYSVKRLQQTQGIWTVVESSMTNDLDHTRTELAVEKIDYNTGLKEDGFSRRTLEGPGR
jgi:hypothetical protein